MSYRAATVVSLAAAEINQPITHIAPPIAAMRLDPEKMFIAMRFIEVKNLVAISLQDRKARRIPISCYLLVSSQVNPLQFKPHSKSPKY